jgi:Protein tyrosine and serine/threonine kinase
MFSYGATPYGMSNLPLILNLFVRYLGEKSGSDVYYSLKYGKRLERPSRCPLSIYELMLECWEWDEKKRPTFAELLYLLEKNSNNREISRKSLIIDEPFNESESKTIIHF